MGARAFTSPMLQNYMVNRRRTQVSFRLSKLGNLANGRPPNRLEPSISHPAGIRWRLQGEKVVPDKRKGSTERIVVDTNRFFRNCFFRIAQSRGVMSTSNEKSASTFTSKWNHWALRVAIAFTLA